MDCRLRPTREPPSVPSSSSVENHSTSQRPAEEDRRGCHGENGKTHQEGSCAAAAEHSRGPGLIIGLHCLHSLFVKSFLALQEPALVPFRFRLSSARQMP